VQIIEMSAAEEAAFEADRTSARNEAEQRRSLKQALITSAYQKLHAVGLSDAEIKALTGK
jgi:hypothetical protein